MLTGSSTADVFVDTSGFYALLVKRDDRHDLAVEVLQAARAERRGFVTSDYILDETATLLKARGVGHLLSELFRTVQLSRACRMEWIGVDRFSDAWSFFLKHADKDWSYTDCTSFVVMRQLHLQQALTKDDHFRQAGFLPLLA